MKERRRSGRWCKKKKKAMKKEKEMWKQVCWMNVEMQQNCMLLKFKE